MIRTGLDVILLQAPQLDNLDPAAGALVHIDSTGALQANNIVISGSRLSFPGQTTIVTVGGQPVSIQPSSPPAEASLTVTLPTDLDAGPQADVRVVLNGRASIALFYGDAVALRGNAGAGRPRRKSEIDPPGCRLHLDAAGSSLRRRRSAGRAHHARSRQH